MPKSKMNRVWSVESDSVCTTFESFGIALCYADKLAANHLKVKVIEPEQSKIRIVPMDHGLDRIEHGFEGEGLSSLEQSNN